MSELAGKTLLALGDSLIRGNRLPPGSTWVELLAQRESMTTFNYGINGNTVALVDEASEPMCLRWRQMPPEADYVVVLGGANDKRLNVPIGVGDDPEVRTFTGALRQLGEGLLARYPRAKLLFLTNYCRYPGENAIGVPEVAYVDTMLSVAEKLGIACFDNYRYSGICFQSDPWMDEGVSLSMTPNRHLSASAYRYLLPLYTGLLKNL